MQAPQVYGARHEVHFESVQTGTHPDLSVLVVYPDEHESQRVLPLLHLLQFVMLQPVL